jgi:hypothetical protein
MKERARGRSTAIDADAIRRKALDGVKAGVRELTATLGESLRQLATLRDSIECRDIGHIPVSCEPI